jgi:hypothetical protein
MAHLSIDLGGAAVDAGARGSRLTPGALRGALAAAVVAAGLLGWLLTSGEGADRAAANAGAELTRLMRLMALLKVALGVGALALVALRFRFAIAPGVAAAYIAAGAIMAAGPGLIWNMDHIGLGALLLHGGLAALVALAWFDGGTRWRLGWRAK